MQTRARPADLSCRERERDETPRVVGAVHVLRDAHAPEDHRARRGGIETRDLADRLRVDAADGRHRFGRELPHVLHERVVARRPVADERLVDEPFVDGDVEERVEQRHVGVGVELQIVGGMAGEIAAPRIRDDQLRPALHRILHPRRRHRMVHRRVGADDEQNLRPGHVAHLIADRARVDPFHQRRHARRVAEARAVIDVVRSESGAYELLEEIRLLVRPFRGAVAGKRTLAVPIARVEEAARRGFERFFPARLAKHLVPLLGIDDEVLVLRDVRLANQRLRQAMAMLDVVEAVAPLHAEAAGVGRAVLPLHVEDAVVLDVIGELTADPAVRAD